MLLDALLAPAGCRGGGAVVACDWDVEDGCLTPGGPRGGGVTFCPARGRADAARSAAGTHSSLFCLLGGMQRTDGCLELAAASAVTDRATASPKWLNLVVAPLSSEPVGSTSS